MFTQEIEFIYTGGVSLPGDLITSPLGPTIIPPSNSSSPFTTISSSLNHFWACSVSYKKWEIIRLNHNTLLPYVGGSHCLAGLPPTGNGGQPAKIRQAKTTMWYFAGHFKARKKEKKWERDRELRQDKRLPGMTGVCWSSEYYPLLLMNSSFNATYSVRHGFLLTFIVLKLPLRHKGLDPTPRQKENVAIS